MKKILCSILCIVLISGHKHCHPNADQSEIEVTKKELVTLGTPENLRSIDVSALVVMQMICLGISV